MKDGGFGIVGRDVDLAMCVRAGTSGMEEEGVVILSLTARSNTELDADDGKRGVSPFSKSAGRALSWRSTSDAGMRIGELTSTEER